MKTTNLILAQTIFSAQFMDFDLYTIKLFNGNVLRFTTADFPIKAAISFAGVTQPAATYATAPFVDQKESKTQAHWKIGLDTDQWTVVIIPRPFDPITGAAFPDQIGDVPWLQAAQGGFLDAADFQVDRAYFNTMPAWPIPVAGAVPIGTVTIFAGTVAEIDTTDAVAVLTVNDYRSLLSYTMPRHYYEAQCRHTLFDAGCGISASSFVKTGSIGAGSTQGIIAPLPAGLTPPSGSSGTFTLGRIVMTSGLNNGFSRTITNWQNNNTFVLVNPFPFALEIGDTFNVYPGCNKMFTTCGLFNNQVNYGGQPWIPAPELAAS